MILWYLWGGSARSPFVKEAAYFALAASASLATDIVGFVD